MCDCGAPIPGASTPMNTTGMGNVDASHLDPLEKDTVELLPKKYKKKRKMKTLKDYIANESVNEAKIDINADHKKVLIDVLLTAYKSNNRPLMTALANTDDKYFDNLAKDYVSFVTGSFGNPDAKILKQAKEGITAFKSMVKLGIKESINEDMKMSDDAKELEAALKVLGITFEPTDYGKYFYHIDDGSKNGRDYETFEELLGNHDTDIANHIDNVFRDRLTD